MSRQLDYQTTACLNDVAYKLQSLLQVKQKEINDLLATNAQLRECANHYSAEIVAVKGGYSGLSRRISELETQLATAATKHDDSKTVLQAQKRDAEAQLARVAAENTKNEKVVDAARRLTELSGKVGWKRHLQVMDALRIAVEGLEEPEK